MAPKVKRKQFPVMVSREDRLMVGRIKEAYELPTGAAAVRYALKRQSVEARMGRGLRKSKWVGSNFNRGTTSDVILTTFMMWLSKEEERWAAYIQRKHNLDSTSEAIRVAVRLEEGRLT